MGVRTVVWAGLAALAVTGLVVGVWAAFAPRSFYDDFPGGGLVWVAVDGPYNEHLVRDVGELNLALTAVTVVAIVTMARAAAVAAALGWLVYQVPHLLYHVRHTDVFADTTDKVTSIVALALGVALPLIVLVAALRLRPSAET
jgi:hypothetical protein